MQSERTFSVEPGDFVLLQNRLGQVFLVVSETEADSLTLYRWGGADWETLRIFPGLRVSERKDAVIYAMPSRLCFDDPAHGQLVFFVHASKAEKGAFGSGYRLLTVDYDGGAAAEVPLPLQGNPPYISRFPDGDFLLRCGEREVYRLNGQGACRFHYCHRSWRSTTDEPGALHHAQALPDGRAAVFLYTENPGTVEAMYLDPSGQAMEGASWKSQTMEPPVLHSDETGFWVGNRMLLSPSPPEECFQKLCFSGDGRLLETRALHLKTKFGVDRTLFTEQGVFLHSLFARAVFWCPFDGGAPVRYGYPTAGASGARELCVREDGALAVMSDYTGHSGVFSIFGFLPDGTADWTIRRTWSFDGNRRMAVSGNQLFLAYSSDWGQMTASVFQLPS